MHVYISGEGWEKDGKKFDIKHISRNDLAAYMAKGWVKSLDDLPDHDYSGEGEGLSAEGQGPSDGGQGQPNTQKPIVAGTDGKDGKMVVGLPLNFINLTKNSPNKTIYIKTKTGEISKY